MDAIVTKVLIENEVDVIRESRRKRNVAVEAEVAVIAKVVMIARIEERNVEWIRIGGGVKVGREGQREGGVKTEREIKIRNPANLIKRKVVIAQKIVIRIRTRERNEITKRVRDIRDAGLDQYQGKTSFTVD